MSWTERITASMCASKQDGMTFVAASKLALYENPPRSQIDIEIAADVMRFHEDAWHDRRPALRGFSLEMLRQFDGTRPAGRPGQHRALDAAVAA